MSTVPETSALGLAGRCALVAGPAAGFAPMLCALLAAAGARVMLAAGDGTDARAVAAGLRGGPPAARGHPPAAPGAPAALVAEAVAFFGGRLDILATFAAGPVHASLAEAGDDAWDAAIGGSLRGRYL
ncbi:MAG: hypothetical protein ACKOUS_09975, partial [Alphaproteobacteria bacterium]